MSQLPEPWRRLDKEILKIREQMRRMRNASPFFGTGIHPTGNGGMASDEFDGNLDTRNAGTKGWAFNGQRVALGEVILRPGSIGNETLTNPVSASAANPSATGFALTTTYKVLASVDMTIPEGFTRVLVHLTGSLYAVNPNATGGSNGQGGDAWNVQLGTNPGYGSYVYPVGVSGLNGFASAHADVSFALDNLVSGSTIQVQVWGASSYQNVAADPTNVASASASMIWFRS